MGAGVGVGVEGMFSTHHLAVNSLLQLSTNLKVSSLVNK